MRVALLELAPDSRTATGERGRAVLAYVRSLGHDTTVISPAADRLRQFSRYRFSVLARLRRRVFGHRTLPHLWDYIADELEPRVRSGNFDVVIARDQATGMVLTRGIGGLKILDMANVTFLEMYHASGADPVEVEATHEREMKILAAADCVLVHHDRLTEFVRRHVYDHPKVVTARMGADPAAEHASWSETPRIVYAGSYYYIQDPYLLSLLSGQSPIPIHCYGSQDPRRPFLPHPLDYQGYEETTRFLANYQFGLVTVSQDRLRRHSPSTKFAYYFARGLPVLFPEWMLEGHEYAAAIPFTEDDFAAVVTRLMRDRDAWERYHAEALRIAASLRWEQTLKPLAHVLDAARDVRSAP